MVWNGVYSRPLHSSQALRTPRKSRTGRATISSTDVRAETMAAIGRMCRRRPAPNAEAIAFAGSRRANSSALVSKPSREAEVSGVDVGVFVICPSIADLGWRGCLQFREFIAPNRRPLMSSREHRRNPFRGYNRPATTLRFKQCHEVICRPH